MEPLRAEQNPFGGRVVDPQSIPNDPAAFQAVLTTALESWRTDGTKVVWLNLPLAYAELVPIAVRAGFVYHHADEQSVELTLALFDGAYVPPHATHYIGAGGVVLAPDRRLLVIQERYHTRRHIKLPGGALHLGEHLIDAVVREVAEETGISTQFRCLVGFRHWHGYRFGKSDIYFVCLLHPLNFDIVLDPEEIAECFWIPVDEYLEHEATHAFNRRIVAEALAIFDAAHTSALAPTTIADYGSPQTHEILLPHPTTTEAPPFVEIGRIAGSVAGTASGGRR